MIRLVIFGSWKVRHAEDLEPGDKWLSFYKVPDRLQEGVSIAADLTECGDPLFEWNGKFEKSTSNSKVSNISGEYVPLGVAELDGTSLKITHLLTRVEVYSSHFLGIEEVTLDTSKDDLVARLFETCDKNHLRLCNFECLYVKGLPDIELEHKYTIEKPFNFYTMNRLFYEKLDNGLVEGFMPQIGDEIQHWSYDNNLAGILKNSKGIGGYVSIMYWSKKKRSNWDERVVTYKKKLFNEDALERWERNYPNVYVDGSPEESLASYFELPLEYLSDWRRTRLDIACEATETGNIFFLNFEDSRVFNDDSVEGRLQQCEIEYHKTRGVPDELSIYRDFEKIGRAMEQFMADQGLEYEKSNYSKLSFLRDYKEAKDGQIVKQEVL